VSDVTVEQAEQILADAKRREQDRQLKEKARLEEELKEKIHVSNQRYTDEQNANLGQLVWAMILRAEYDCTDEGTVTLALSNGIKVSFSASGDDATTMTYNIVKGE
jgi:hypothetical protein